MTEDAVAIEMPVSTTRPMFLIYLDAWQLV